MDKSVTKSIVGLFGYLIGLFLIIYILNYFIKYIPLSFFKSTALFLDKNLILIIGIILFLKIGEIIGTLGFPSNLFSPASYSIGGALVVTLILEIINLFDFLKTTLFFYLVMENKTLIYLIGVVAILVLGYMPIVYNYLRNKKPNENSPKESFEKMPEKETIQIKKKKNNKK